MNAYRNVAFVGIVIFIFGVVVGIYGLSFYFTQSDLEQNGVIVEGEVFEINQKAIYRSPFVKFTSREGKEHRFLSQLEVNMDFFDYKIGQKVEVIYHERDPNQAKIYSFWENYFEPIFLGGFGIFLMMLGYFFRKRMLRKANAYKI